MPRKTVSLPALADVYRGAFESAAALWPIFFIRIGFLILNLLMIALFLLIGFWPILQVLMGHLGDLTYGNFKSVFQEMNFVSYFTDFHTILLVGLMAAFYITCVIFFLAFFYAALCSQINRHQKEGELFSLGRFFSDGFKFTLPMMGLLFIWIFLFLVFAVGFCLVLALGALVFGFLPWWLKILLALPAGSLVFLVSLGLWATSMMSGAYLVDEYGVIGSIKESALKVLSHKGRVVWANLLIFIIYFIFYFAFNAVFSVFGKLPLVGILFLLVEFGVNMVLAIGFNIYMTAVNVVLQLEPKDAK